MAKTPPQPPPQSEPESDELWYIRAGHDVRHGTTSVIYRDKDGVRLEVALRIYAELIGQTARANRLHDLAMPNLAKQAINAADAFLKELDNAS